MRHKHIVVLLLLAACGTSLVAAQRTTGGGNFEPTSVTGADDSSDGSSDGVDASPDDTTGMTDLADSDNTWPAPAPAPLDSFAANGLAPSPALADDMESPGQPDRPSRPVAVLEPATVPEPAPVQSPPPPPPSPPPPPPPPSGILVTMVVRLAGMSSPMPDDLTAGVVATLSALSPDHPWSLIEQQPSYPGQAPNKPRMMAGADAAPTPAPSSPSAPSREDEAKASVDPLPINGLGRKLRQAAAAATPVLVMSEKGQCYSTKHALAPDEPTCALWCEGQLADGKVDAAEYGTRFYDKKGASCCGCNANKGGGNDTANAAVPNIDAPAPAAPAAPAAATDKPESKPDAETKPDDAKATPEEPAAAASAPTADAPTPSASTSVDGANAPDDGEKEEAKVDEGADGVYLFASTVVLDSEAERALNATMREAAGAGRLMNSLKYTAGVTATSADIVFLSSGEFNFTPPAARYKRPAYGAVSSESQTQEPTPAPASSSNGGSNGMMLGIIVGSVAAVLIVSTVAIVCVVRRKRNSKGKLEGQGLARKWESERHLAADERRRQQEERRAASEAANDRYWAHVHTQTVRFQKMERVRSALGMGPRDHLSAAAARMEAAETAEVEAAKGTAAAPPAPGSSSKAMGSKPAPPAASRAAATPTIALSAHSSAAGEPPLNSVMVHQQLQQQRPSRSSGPAPSWATRDPGAEPKPSSAFGRWFSRE